MIPHELSIGDVYFSPLLLATIMAVIATWITTIILNKTQLARFFMFPSTTFIAIWVGYLALIDQFILPF